MLKSGAPLCKRSPNAILKNSYVFFYTIGQINGLLFVLGLAL